MRSTPHSVRRERMKSATSSATMLLSQRLALRCFSRQERSPKHRTRSGSEVDEAHVRIAISRGRALRKRLVDAREVVRGQLDVCGGGVLLEVADALGAGDRDD